MRTADGLRANGIAAAALFKPSMGGWIVQIFPGGIRQRPALPTAGLERGRPAFSKRADLVGSGRQGPQ